MGEHQSELAHGHAVTDGEGMQADEREVPGIENVALDPQAADRVRTIQHDQANAVHGTGLHGVQHRVDERVVARADVLDVEDQDVDPGQHFRGGNAGLAIEAEDRQTGPRVLAVAHFFEVLGICENTVLRTEERHQFGALQVLEMKGGMGQVGSDRGGIGEQTQALPPDPRGAGQKFLRARCLPASKRSDLDALGKRPYRVRWSASLPTFAPEAFVTLPSMTSPSRRP